MEIFGHVSYVLYLASYAVRDILWLRVLTILAGGCLLPFFYFQPKVMWIPFFWISLFNVINIYQIGILLLERRPVGMSPEEKRIFHRHFPAMNARVFKKMVELAQWKDAEEGDLLIKKGEAPRALMLFSSGALAVRIEGRDPIPMEEGQFVGELAFITDGTASADVVATSPARYLAWPSGVLRRHMDQETAIGKSVQNVLGADVAIKLRNRNLHLSSQNLAIT